eukprot:maker-scaffold_3-snap-gene-2.0-mRNA-1 protein AED:0.00 eAED:0.00 QI:166/1/1/1/1/1/2/309/466
MSGQDVEMSDENAFIMSQLEEIEDSLRVDPKRDLAKLRELTKKPKIIRNENDVYEFDPVYEKALNLLIKALTYSGDSSGLVQTLASVRPVFSQLSKSKRENLVKSVFSNLSTIPNTSELQINLCKEYIKYFSTPENNRPLLAQFFQTKLAALLVDGSNLNEALAILSTLQTAVKKLDDKLLLVEINLIESRARYLLGNMAKARSTLTAARTNANQVYVPIELQAEIDLQSGVLNSHDNDFKTAFSYFLESYDAFSSLQKIRGKKAKAGSSTVGAMSVYQMKAIQSFRLMMLSKLMDSDFTGVTGLLSNKYAIENSYSDDLLVKLLLALNSDVKDKNLEKYTKNYDAAVMSKIIEEDIMKSHLESLKNELLERNLLKIILPYERVEIERIAELIKLPEEEVMAKLSQMILDQKFEGILDQGLGELIVYEKVEGQEEKDAAVDSLQLIENMEGVVDTLIRRAKALQVV